MDKVRMVELMEYQDFLVRIKDEVQKVIGDGYDLKLNHVLKNNSIELDGLVILKEHERVSPNIYLNLYYEKYLEGSPIGDMVDEIINLYTQTLEEGKREPFYFNYEFNEMKSSVIYRLINFDRNKKLLQEVPYVKFLDLAITFHCLVKNNEEGIGTIRITNEHMDNWNIDIDELKEIARKNTPIIFPCIIRKMNDVILDIFTKEILLKQSQDKLLDSIIDEMESARSNEMYVISNTKGINGASCLLYPNILANLSDELSTDFYILPSSIHEIILVKDNGLLDKKTLNNMVVDVNFTQVPEDEILSDHVYFYSRERDGIIF